MIKSSFKKGDFVEVLDDTIKGVVVSVENTVIKIETTEGFDLEFESFELVKITTNLSEENLFKSKSINNVVAEKSLKKRGSKPIRKKKERHLPTMEVDLHLHQLVKNERHLTSHDKKNIQLDTAKHKLDYAIKNNIQKIVFIHGVGEGVLKLELEYLFNRYDNIKFYDADYKKYGLGATEVYVFQNQK